LSINCRVGLLKKNNFKNQIRRDFYRFAFSIILIFTLYHNLYAGDTGRGGYAGSFLRMGLGAGALASGGGSAVFYSDATAAYYNPAGLVFLKNGLVTTSVSSMSLDRSVSFVGYAQPLKPADNQSAGFSVGWIGAGVANIDGRDTNGLHTDTYSSSENCFYLSFAHSAGSFLSIGITTKVLYYRFPGMADGGSLSAKGVGFDLGVMAFPLPNVSAGFVIKDLHSRYTWNTQSVWEKGTQKSDQFPVVFSGGASVSFYSGRGTLSANYEKINFMPGTLSVGAEFIPADQIALRCGLFRGDITFGAGFFFKIKEHTAVFDYAYVADPIGPGNINVLTGTFIF